MTLFTHILPIQFFTHTQMALPTKYNICNSAYNVTHFYVNLHGQCDVYNEFHNINKHRKRSINQYSIINDLAIHLPRIYNNNRKQTTGKITKKTFFIDKQYQVVHF